MMVAVPIFLFAAERSKGWRVEGGVEGVGSTHFERLHLVPNLLKIFEIPSLNEIFSSSNFFLLPEQFQKLLAFLIPIFGNVDGSWRVTSKLRGSTLIQVARRCSKVFQRFSASLVRVGDVQGVSRRHAVRGKKEHHMGVLLGLKNCKNSCISMGIASYLT